jgi:hypothetical protein
LKSLKAIIYTWKMKMKFFLHVYYFSLWWSKDTLLDLFISSWEFVLGELLPFYIEFEVPKGSIHELCMFMKKYKLVRRTILLKIVDFLLHHMFIYIQFKPKFSWVLLLFYVYFHPSLTRYVQFTMLTPPKCTPIFFRLTFFTWQ